MQTTMSATVLLIDDHPLYREGIKASLGRTGGYRVVAEADHGRAGIAEALRTKPDLVVVDIALPGLNGIQVVSRLTADLPSTRCLVLSGLTSAEYVLDAFEAGAFGYMTKETASECLMQGLDSIRRGDVFLDPTLSREVLDQLMLARRRKPLHSAQNMQELTPREIEVVELLVSGREKEDIARTLKISSKTVENHRSRIMGKLGLKSDMELIRYAARTGIIDIDYWVRGK